MRVTSRRALSVAMSNGRLGTWKLTGHRFSSSAADSQAVRLRRLERAAAAGSRGPGARQHDRPACLQSPGARVAASTVEPRPVAVSLRRVLSRTRLVLGPRPDSSTGRAGSGRAAHPTPAQRGRLQHRREPRYGHARAYRHKDIGLVVDLGGTNSVAKPLGIELTGLPARRSRAATTCRSSPAREPPASVQRLDP